MGARLGCLTVAAVLLLGGCGTKLHLPAADTPGQASAPATTAASIPEPAPSAPPYADAGTDVRAVAEAFVGTVLVYDASTGEAADFLGTVAPITTPTELESLRRSPRARLDWRVLRDRQERTAIVVTGISTAPGGRVMVTAERTTTTTFATVRDFVEVRLRLVASDGALRVAEAEGGGL